ncbi:hypothetical protein [Candidatus Entotheonella palauensis]|uniref:hypothetical protein n=1 Tax=Candidatus Entotheonella palauensis TaxID=93172 RepID=UPI000B7CD58F|nr:hypothetical protein [Candidatus Entotheonella palauensis]
MTDRSAAPNAAATEAASDGRHLGLAGATGIGVGAIVGGGILALAGVAFAADEVPIPVNVEVLTSGAPADTITRHAARNDLTILGLQRFHRRRKVFGDMVLHVARHSPGPLLLLSRRG